MLERAGDLLTRPCEIQGASQHAPFFRREPSAVVSLARRRSGCPSARWWLLFR